MTFAQQLEAVALPEEMVDSLSTEELADWVLAYPFLGDLMLFDTARAAMDYYSRTSYLFRRFFERKDVVEVLLNEYENLHVDYRMLADEHPEGFDVFTESGYFKELFLRTYFYTVRNELFENEKVILKDILKEKEEEKVGVYENYTIKILSSEDIWVENKEVCQADLSSAEDQKAGEACGRKHKGRGTPRHMHGKTYSGMPDTEPGVF